MSPLRVFCSCGFKPPEMANQNSRQLARVLKCVRLAGAGKEWLLRFAEPQRQLCDALELIGRKSGYDLIGRVRLNFNLDRRFAIPKPDPPAMLVCSGMQIAYENIRARHCDAF
jgi:hypothetical protein